MSDNNAMAMGGLLSILQTMADELDRDVPLLQAMAFLRIAKAGSSGVDHGQMQGELKASSAAMSRTVQVLSDMHPAKDRPGFGLVEREFDPQDNRRRIVRLTPKGEKVAAKLAAQLSKV